MKGIGKYWYEKTLKIHWYFWFQYLVVLLIMGLFSALPIVLFGGIETISKTGRQFFVWYLLFWAAIAFVFCLVTAWQKQQAFDRPMQILADAARKVANGDFSVYIEPLHLSESQKYVELMFQDFNAMVRELRSLEMMKTDFISNVSHEFKTPLAVIQMYASDLKDRELPKELQQEYLETIVSSVFNLNSLVSNILRLNKIENQTLPLQYERFDLCQQLCDCVISFGESLDQKKIDFSADLEDACWIQGDVELLSLVWNNLLSNAIKFSEIGGAVHLKQRCQNQAVIVSLTDSGCGMDETVLQRIFDKFYQAETSRSKQGNGLGMALVKRVLDLSGGTIEIRSELGKGTTFTITLPMER